MSLGSRWSNKVRPPNLDLDYKRCLIYGRIHVTTSTLLTISFVFTLIQRKSERKLSWWNFIG